MTLISQLCMIATMEKINIPLAIKNARRSLGISQRQLAELIGATRSRIADYETNRSRIAAEDWVKIQALLYPLKE